MSNARFSILQARAVEDKRISNAQFRTLAALGMYGDKDGWCFPKLSTLGIILNKSRQSVSQDIQALKRIGYIETIPQFRDDGSRRNNLYRLIFDPTYKAELDTPQANELDTPSSSELDALTPQDNASIEKEDTPPALPEVGNLAPLSVAFVNETHIPELTGGPEKWVAALKEMQAAGVEPQDIVTAVRDMRDKDFSIVTLRSIVNPSIMAMSKRKSKRNGRQPKPIDYSQYDTQDTDDDYDPAEAEALKEIGRA